MSVCVLVGRALGVVHHLRREVVVLEERVSMEVKEEVMAERRLAREDLVVGMKGCQARRLLLVMGGRLKQFGPEGGEEGGSW